MFGVLSQGGQVGDMEGRVRKNIFRLAVARHNPLTLENQFDRFHDTLCSLCSCGMRRKPQLVLWKRIG